MKNRDLPQLPQLRAGDVLFYKTRKDIDEGPEGDIAGRIENIDSGDFDDLDVLCAYAQTLPYRKEDKYRPWFHVSVCSEGGEDPKEIGFQQQLIKQGVFEFAEGPVNQAQFPDLPFDEADLSGRSPDVAIQVLRPPEGWDVDAVIARGKDMVQREDKVRYAYSTLLTFALATVARTMPASMVRRNNMATARGSSVLAYGKAGINEQDIARSEDLVDRPDEKIVVNCVTGAALMLDAGLGAETTLMLPEPPVPDERPDPLIDRHSQAIKDLLKHLVEIDAVNMVATNARPDEAEAIEYLQVLGVDPDRARRDVSIRASILQARVSAVEAMVTAGVDRDEIVERIRDEIDGFAKFLGAPVETPEYTAALEIVVENFAGSSKQDFRDADHLGDGTTELPPWNLTIGPAMLWEALTEQHGWCEVR